MQLLTDVLCAGQEAPCLQELGARSCCVRRRPRCAPMVGLLEGGTGRLHDVVEIATLLPWGEFCRQVKSLSKTLLLLVCSLRDTGRVRGHSQAWAQGRWTMRGSRAKLLVVQRRYSLDGDGDGHGRQCPRRRSRGTESAGAAARDLIWTASPGPA